MGGVEFRKYLLKTFVAPRTRSAAFDAKTEPFTHDMNIGQVCNTPDFPSSGSGQKAWMIARLGHQSIREPPRQSGHCEIDGNDHDGVEKCGMCEDRGRREIGEQSRSSGYSAMLERQSTARHRRSARRIRLHLWRESCLEQDESMCAGKKRSASWRSASREIA